MKEAIKSLFFYLPAIPRHNTLKQSLYLLFKQTLKKFIC
jgi:hypothetical protein